MNTNLRSDAEVEAASFGETASLHSAPLPKVMIVTPEYPPYMVGGLGTHVFELTKGLSEQGCPVTVLAPTTEAEEVTTQASATIHHIHLDKTLFKPSITAVADRVRSSNELFARYGRALIERGERPDLIHCHDWHSFPAARQLGQMFGIPVVATLHLLNYPLQNRWGSRIPPGLREMEGFLCREADSLITVSDSMRNLIHATHAVPKERIHVVYNGFSVEDFLQPQMSAEELSSFRRNFAAPDEQIILFAGRLNPQKGIAALLESAARVVAQKRNVRYLVAGGHEAMDEGQMLQGLKKSFPHYAHLWERFKLLGVVPRQQLARLYQIADISIVPSIYEPFGYAAIEAMAAGVPVVATSVGGLAEIVTHERTGLLVPVQPLNATGLHVVDVKRLTEAQIALLNDSAMRERLGEAGRRYATTTFTFERMIRATIEVYRKTARASASAAS